MTIWDDTYQVSTQHKATINTGIGTVDSFTDTAAKAVEWRYVIDKGSGTNMRTGKIGAVFNTVSDSVPVIIPDEGSPDIGTTWGIVTLSVDKTGNSVRLRATVTSDGWTIDVVRTLIGAPS